MDANELGRWTRFAAKGGIGKCTAVQDCVAEGEDDLMFLKDDEIIVLMQLQGADDLYLGYCEGVVGRFKGTDVQFHARLKKPIMTKRSSTAGGSTSRPPSAQSSPIDRSAHASPVPFFPPHARLASSAPTRSASDPQSIRDLARDSPVSQLSVPPLAFEEDLGSRSASHASLATSTTFDSFPRTPSESIHSGAARDDKTPEVHILQGEVQGEGGIDVDECVERTSNDEGTAPLRLCARTHPAADDSFLDSEPSTRISIALSEGEGNVGVGLALLQDLADEEDGDGTPSRARTPERGAAASLQLGSDSPVLHRGAVSAPSVRSVTYSESQYSMSPRSTHQPLDAPQIHASASAEPSSHASHPSTSSHPGTSDPEPSSPSRASMHASVMSSEYDFDGEEWEGATDIYDNYRYSMYSMMSKRSRLSRGSVYTVASNFDVPPVPAEHQRPSFDMKELEMGRKRTESDSSQGAASAAGSSAAAAVAATSSEEAPQRSVRGRPSPLSFAESTTSPLLHATFGLSPTSPTPASTNSFLSPALVSPLSPTASGVASALRLRLEHPSSPMSPASPDSPVIMTEFGKSARRGAGEEDTGANIELPDPWARSEGGEASGAPGSSTSSQGPQQQAYSKEKEALFGEPEQEQEQAPPPPYTLMSSDPQSQHQPQPQPQPQRTPSASTQRATPTQVQPQSQSQSFLQPGPRLRPQAANRSEPNEFIRASIFMPHPHAPKPTGQLPAGPMYARQPAPPHLAYPPSGPPPGSVTYAINTLLAARRQMPYRQLTLFAHFPYDLASAAGPVPVSFAHEPQNNVPANKVASLKGRPGQGQVQGRVEMGPAPTSPTQSMSPPPPGGDGATPIPRANFFPKAQTPRPRSRSFSGFDSPVAEVELPSQNHGDEVDPSIHAAAQTSAKRSGSAQVATTTAAATTSAGPLPPAQRAAVSHSSSLVRGNHAPSPLSLSQNVIAASRSPSPKSPSSPRSVSSVLSKATSLSTHGHGSTTSHTRSLGQASTDISTSAAKEPMEGVPRTTSLQPSATETSPTASSPPPSPRSPSSTTSFPVVRHSRSSIQLGSNTAEAGSSVLPRTSLRGRKSADSVGLRAQDLRRTVTSPPLESLPEARASTITYDPSIYSTTSGSLRSPGDRSGFPEPHSPILSVNTMDTDHETVQVQDMDFELVRPAILHSPIAASSVDSLPLSAQGSSRADNNSLLRPTSPAFSTLSGSSGKNPVAETARPSESPDMAAHRQRELRWISTMSSVPAGQSRKNKKIRKLIAEGVPASVRYVVWAYLTDSKAKRINGLYEKFGRRENIVAAGHIQHDVRLYSAAQPDAQEDALTNVLHAYLAMVPDVRYSKGLTLIAGQLLALGPEEDAFWTFVSLMDSHLRPYFSSNPIQLEVDASLFSKAVEANDAAMAKKCYVDMAISPFAVCQPWFTSVFADTLPPDYLHRVWDVFLYEGVPFLFRVGLAIFQCCRRPLLECSSQDALLALLSRPPPACLPGTADAFLDVASSVKLKDDDLRKQRSKLEAQVKRQAQARTMANISSAISLPRS